MVYLLEQQLLLAQNGIPINDSQQLCDFERESFVDLILKQKQENNL